MLKFFLGLGLGVAGTLGVVYVVNRVRAAKPDLLAPVTVQPNFAPITGGMVNRGDRVVDPANSTVN